MWRLEGGLRCGVTTFHCRQQGGGYATEGGSIPGGSPAAIAATSPPSIPPPSQLRHSPCCLPFLSPHLRCARPPAATYHICNIIYHICNITYVVVMQVYITFALHLYHICITSVSHLYHICNIAIRWQSGSRFLKKNFKNIL